MTKNCIYDLFQKIIKEILCGKIRTVNDISKILYESGSIRQKLSQDSEEHGYVVRKTIIGWFIDRQYLKVEFTEKNQIMVCMYSNISSSVSKESDGIVFAAEVRIDCETISYFLI